MRLSVALLLLALAGVLGGGALIGLPALGGCLIFDSLCVGAWALLRDDGSAAQPLVTGIADGIPPELRKVIDRARGAAA